MKFFTVLFEQSSRDGSGDDDDDDDDDDDECDAGFHHRLTHHPLKQHPKLGPAERKKERTEDGSTLSNIALVHIPSWSQLVTEKLQKELLLVSESGSADDNCSFVLIPFATAASVALLTCKHQLLQPENK